MNLKAGLAATLLIIGTPAVANEAPAPLAPAEEPDWSLVRRNAETLLKANLFDPSSAQIQWEGGWRWGHIKWIKLFTTRVWGWLGCANLNAKNRLGGYVGAQSMFVLLKPDGSMESGNTSDYTSECDQPDTTALQPAFMNAPSVPAAAPISVADELAKLAELRDKGVITSAEFDAQKAKLLSR